MTSLSGAQNEEATLSGGITIMEVAEITQPVCQMSREKEEDPEEHKH